MNSERTNGTSDFEAGRYISKPDRSETRLLGRFLSRDNKIEPTKNKQQLATEKQGSFSRPIPHISPHRSQSPTSIAYHGTTSWKQRGVGNGSAPNGGPRANVSPPPRRRSAEKRCKPINQAVIVGLCASQRHSPHFHTPTKGRDAPTTPERAYFPPHGACHLLIEKEAAVDMGFSEECSYRPFRSVDR